MSSQSQSATRPGLTAHYRSSASASAAPSSQQGKEIHQAQMKALMEDELKNKTFYVNLTTEDAIFCADPKHVENVMNDLENTLHALTSDISSATVPRFPKEGFSNEKASYDPLAALLNEIFRTAEEYVHPQSRLRRLRFHQFGNEMKDRFGSLRGLKPDVVGIFGDLPTKLSWNQMEVCVESKLAVADMVRQSGTYARCRLLSNFRRFFSLAIGFQWQSLEAYIFVFHRSGLSSSRPLKVTTAEGFEGLVTHIVGMLSIKDDAAYGLDTTRSEKMFYINNRYYEIVRHLYVRNALQGRCTVVYSLQATTDTPQHGLESRELTLSTRDDLPDKIAYKQTYQLKGRSQEGRLLSDFNDRFGIVDVIGFHTCGPEDPHGSTGRLSNGAEFWRVFGQKDLLEDPRHDDRGLQCIALSGEGQALIDLNVKDGGIPSPSDLLESILHAIIGHYNLFDKGVLHRDVSAGNVLRYLQPVNRPALDKFECTREVVLCRGFLIDGDHAVKWREFSGSRSISGTMEFMSMRLLSAWEVDKKIIHTALDDLESFLWLLIWGIVQVLKGNPEAMANNDGIKHMLNAWSGGIIYNLSKRTLIEENWNDAVFGDLIREWLSIFRRARAGNDEITRDMSTMELGGQDWVDTCNEFDSYCRTIYKDVLESGFKHLDKVKRYLDWGSVASAKIVRVAKRRREEHE